MTGWFKWISSCFAPCRHPGRWFSKNSHWPDYIFMKKKGLPPVILHGSLPVIHGWYSDGCPTPSGSYSLLKTITSVKTRSICHRTKFCWLHSANCVHFNVHLIGWEVSQARWQICCHQAIRNWLSLIKVILKIKLNLFHFLAQDQ